MILRARHVVTMDGELIDNGAVRVEGNRIAEVGGWSEVKTSGTSGTLDLGECALLPGLINAHCHLDYTSLRTTIPPRPSFTDWIEAINARKASLTAEDYLQSISAGFSEAAGFGTTTIANLEAFPELLSRMTAPPLRTWWFPELIDVRTDQSAARTYEKIRTVFDADEGWLGGIGLAPHAPYTASVRLYAEVAKVARTHQLPVSTHLAESHEEMQMFRNGDGPLFGFMQRVGRPMQDCGRTTPLDLLLSQKVIDQHWIVAHLNELTDQDLAQLASGPRFHIVHCPRSRRYFGHSPFRLTELRDLGFNICVGTDSLASNEDLSLFSELRQLSKTEPSLSPRELFEMATINAATALGQAASLGRIRNGYLADLIALPCHGASKDPREELLAFSSRVPWLIVGARIVRQPT